MNGLPSRRVWIDLSNSPHPLLFAPVSRALEERGHTVLVTVRDHAQTMELALSRWPGAEVIGGESPVGRAGKARALAGRVSDHDKADPGVPGQRRNEPRVEHVEAILGHAPGL